MLIDCASCVARDIACGGCVVRVLLDAPALDPPALDPPALGPLAPTGAVVELDAAEQAAIRTLARAGLVPPLRLVRPVSGAEADVGIEADVGAGFGATFGADFGSGGPAPGSGRPGARGIA